MDILVCGAGVIGTLYAARLQGAGNQVTILARGRRLEEIRRHGLVLDNVLTGVRTATQVGAVERLDSNIRYDIALALVIVRRAQLVRLGAQNVHKTVKLCVHKNSDLGGMRSLAKI